MDYSHVVKQLIALVRDYKITRSLKSGCTGGLAHELAGMGFKKLGEGNFSAVVAHPMLGGVVFKIGGDVNDGWLAFATYVSMNPDPIFPKIHALHMCKGYYVAVVERLSGSSDDTDIRSKAGEGSMAFFGVPAYDKLVGTLGHPDDVHAGNIMRRGDQFVLTDPYAYGVNRQYLPPAPQEDRETIQVALGCYPALETELGSNTGEAVAAAGQGIVARAQPEDKALRELAIMPHFQWPKRMAGVLPQMRRHGVEFAEFLINGPRARSAPRPERQERLAPIGHENRLRGHRADFVIVDDLVTAGRHRIRVTHRLLARMDFAHIERRVADNPDWFQPDFGRGFVPQTTPRRPEPKVQPDNEPAREERVPKQARPHPARGKHWWNKRDKIPIRLRRD